MAETIGQHQTRELVVVTKSTVPVGTAEKVRAASRVHAKLPVPRGLEPRVPEGGRRGRRLHEARSRRARRGERFCARRHGGAVRAVRAHGQADHLHGRPVGRDDEVRGERDARDAHLVHERDREPLREGRARTSTSCAGASAATRASGRRSSSRARVRRLVLPEGRAGADAHVATTWARRCSCCRPSKTANERQKHRLFEKLAAALGGGAARVRAIAVWGLAFKAQTDDMRESPALTLIEELLGGRRDGRRARPRGHARGRAASRRRASTFAPTNYDALAGADALVVVTDWNEYRVPGFRAHQGARSSGRSSSTAATCTTRAKMQALGFTYRSLGRGRAVRVLITGAAGFLGSHLTDRFLADGHSRGRPRQLHHRAPRQHRAPRERAALQFMRQEHLRLTRRWTGALDGVLHFASPASPIDYLELPIQTLKVGSLGTHNALGIALAKKARFFIAYHVRGVRRSARASADRGVLGQREPDRAARRVRRGQAVRRGDDDGVPPRTTASTRASSGSSTPTARACGRATGGWCRTSSCRRCNGEPITIYGDGSQTRSFCYVDDEVEGIYRLFKRGDALPTNIGNPVEYTVKQLAEIVVELTRTHIADFLQAAPRGRPKGAPARHYPRARNAPVGAAGGRARGHQPARSNIFARCSARRAWRRGDDALRLPRSRAAVLVAALAVASACRPGFQPRAFPSSGALFTASLDRVQREALRQRRHRVRAAHARSCRRATRCCRSRTGISRTRTR